MANPTLYEALNSFNEQYVLALETNSHRKVEILDKQSQQISNYWDLYFQASAESNFTAATAAIDAIVDILGGDIDTSVLPETGAAAAVEKDGIESVIAVNQKISFSSDIGSSSYRLLINIHDSNGNPIAYVMGAQESDGFYITPSFSGTLKYNAKIISV